MSGLASSCELPRLVDYGYAFPLSNTRHGAYRQCENASIFIVSFCGRYWFVYYWSVPLCEWSRNCPEAVVRCSLSTQMVLCCFGTLWLCGPRRIRDQNAVVGTKMKEKERSLRSLSRMIESKPIRVFSFFNLLFSSEPIPVYSSFPILFNSRPLSLSLSLSLLVDQLTSSVWEFSEGNRSGQFFS